MYDNMNKEQEEILEDFESVVKDELTCNLKTTNWYLDYTDNLIQNYSDVFGTIKLYILTASSSPEIKDQIIGLVVFAVVPINLTQSEIKEIIDADKYVFKKYIQEIDIYIKGKDNIIKIQKMN